MKGLRPLLGKALALGRALTLELALPPSLPWFGPSPRRDEATEWLWLERSTKVDLRGCLSRPGGCLKLALRGTDGRVLRRDLTGGRALMLASSCLILASTASLRPMSSSRFGVLGRGGEASAEKVGSPSADKRVS